MTDYGMPEADTRALDKAYTEESVRRAKVLADDLYEAAAHPRTGPAIRSKTGELSSLLYRLGVHLDSTAGYNITGGDGPDDHADKIVPGAALYVRCIDCGHLIDHIRFGWYPMADDASLCHLCGPKRGLTGLIPAEQG